MQADIPLRLLAVRMLSIVFCSCDTNAGSKGWAIELAAIVTNKIKNITALMNMVLHLMLRCDL